MNRRVGDLVIDTKFPINGVVVPGDSRKGSVAAVDHEMDIYVVKWSNGEYEEIPADELVERDGFYEYKP